jgi:hypothetical protein
VISSARFHALEKLGNASSNASRYFVVDEDGASHVVEALSELMEPLFVRGGNATASDSLPGPDAPGAS